jgi:enoyl-CoA hydratase/carnithine racemase
VSLRVERDGRICRLTLASPDKKNTIDGPLSLALLSQIDAAQQDPEIHVVLLAADGPVFCGGSSGVVDQGIYSLHSRLTKPLIVAAQGVVLGVGLALLASAHVALAAQGSSFGLVDIREGRWNPALFAAVARAIGERRARELYLTGRIFTAPEALSWGLVHQVAPAFELEDRAHAIAESLSNADAETIGHVIGAS